MVSAASPGEIHSNEQDKVGSGLRATLRSPPFPMELGRLDNPAAPVREFTGRRVEFVIISELGNRHPQTYDIEAIRIL